MIKISLLKALDASIGKMAIALLPLLTKAGQSRARPDRFQSVLLIRPGGIGDAVLLIPAIHALKKMGPDSTIDILAEHRNSQVFSFTNDVNAVFHYDKPKELFAVIRKKYDLVIDTEQWHRLSAIVSGIIRSRWSAGFSTNERMHLFTSPVTYSHEEYEADSFFHLIRPVLSNPAVFAESIFLTVPSSSRYAAESLLQSLKRPFVALFPGSSIKERKWGRDRFRQLARFLSRKGYGNVVVGGKQDIYDGQRIIDGIPDSISLCGKLSLPETGAVLQESSLLVTSDSGLMHIGYGLGIKIVALFGPGREQKWAPRGRNCIVINKNLPCSPCTSFGNTPRCRKDAACMKAISADDVFEASIKLLAE